MTTARRIAALERAPSFLDPERMSLGELQEEIVRVIGERDAEKAQALRACGPRDALTCARAMLAEYIEQGARKACAP
jgi:hypothetical protein